MGLKSVIEFQNVVLTNQLMDSELESTRVYWRKKLGFKEPVVNDPRTIKEILEEWENEAHLNEEKEIFIQHPKKP